MCPWSSESPRGEGGSEGGAFLTSQPQEWGLQHSAPWALYPLCHHKRPILGGLKHPRLGMNLSGS